VADLGEGLGGQVFPLPSFGKKECRRKKSQCGKQYSSFPLHPPSLAQGLDHQLWRGLIMVHYVVLI